MPRAEPSPGGWRRRVAAGVIIGATRVATGLNARWIGCAPDDQQRIYFANHTSHGDFVAHLGRAAGAGSAARTRPVAGADYWAKGALRRFIGQRCSTPC